MIGRTDMEDALKKLDELTQEEARMAIAENLRATHAVEESVRIVATTVLEVDQSVARVDDRVGGVSDQVAGVDDRVAVVNDNLASVDGRVARVDDRVTSIDNMVAIVNDSVKDIDTALDQIRRSSYSYLISADYRTLTYF